MRLIEGLNGHSIEMMLIEGLNGHSIEMTLSDSPVNWNSARSLTFGIRVEVRNFLVLVLTLSRGIG
jgi:hypothetical protein